MSLFHFFPCAMRTSLAPPADRALEIANAAFQAAHTYSLDVALILAVAAKESSFREVGNPGMRGQPVDPLKPHGLMQVSGKYHSEKFPRGVARVTDVYENIHIGTHVLSEYLDKANGNVRHALQRYNGAAHDPRSSYALDVLQLRHYFTQALLLAPTAKAST